MDLFSKLNDDVNSYNETFDTLLYKVYIILAPIFCLWIFYLRYFPVILNRWFEYPANVEFPKANPDWGNIHTFFYNCMNPPMGEAVYFNTLNDVGQYSFIFGSLPIYFIIFTIVYCIVAAIIYWTIWNNIIGPYIGSYLAPIVDAAFKNTKR